MIRSSKVNILKEELKMLKLKRNELDLRISELEEEFKFYLVKEGLFTQEEMDAFNYKGEKML